MARRQGWSAEEAVARCTEVDRSRQQFTRYFFGDAATQPAQFDLVVNTGRVPLDDVVAAVKGLVTSEATSVRPSSQGRRVLTLSRELGAGDQGFAPPLAGLLGLQGLDRDLLEEEAKRLGVSSPELDKIDEQPAGLFQRFRPGSLHQRYFEI